MRLLVIGGTRFVGRAIVRAALEKKWSVTTFTRGLSGTDISGAQVIRGDRTNLDDLNRLRSHGPWDAIIDVSGRAPLDVHNMARVLRDQASRYVFVSSVSAYADWPAQAVSESSRLWKSKLDDDFSDYPPADAYGMKKAGSERAVLKIFGDSSIIVRPSVILGPEEDIGRLPWWLNRIAKGGRVIAPAPRDEKIQPVDVRDLATFITHLLERDITGTFNAAAPIGKTTFEDLLTACIAATQSDATLEWVSPHILAEAGIGIWTELPIWSTIPGTWLVDDRAARQAGLTCRPISTTVQDTWNWLQNGENVEETLRSAALGLPVEKERQLFERISNSTS